MTQKKTIAIFGAGSGLGASVARRFGREGYHVALVARRASVLEEHVAELANEGISATAFAADLTDTAAIAGLVASIEAALGRIDVAVYAPLPPGFGFVPAAQLDAAKLQQLAPLYTFGPVEVANRVLPGMLARGDGAIVIVGGSTAVKPMPGFSGVGPVMAAARNYVLTLNGEVADKGVYAGGVSIGSFIGNSTGMRSAQEAGIPIDPAMVIQPDRIADEIWTSVTRRERAEVMLP